jgi:Leucine-rich repeat (LRR) protein
VGTAVKNNGPITRGSSKDAPAGVTTSPNSNKGTLPQNVERKNSDNGPRRNVSNLSNSATGDSLQSAEKIMAPLDAKSAERKRRVKKVLEQCEPVGWPFKKKLLLSNLDLRYDDIPTEWICSDKLGPLLYKLSLRGNPLISSVPNPLVTRLRGLRTLDLSNCNLRSLPDTWDLPSLKKLCLGRNKLGAFPNESLFRGTPLLEHLELYENLILELKLPDKISVLSKLEYLDLDFNW